MFFKKISIFLSFLIFSLPAFSAGEATTENIREVFFAINSLVFYVALFLGLVIFIGGLLSIYNNSKDPQRNPISNAFTKLLIGTMLMIPGFMYNVSVNSFFGTTWETVEYENALNIAQVYEIESEQASSGSIVARFQGTKTGTFVYSFIYLIGIYSFLKSIFLCKNLGLMNQGPDSDNLKKKIIIHYFAGIFLMNIMFFSCKFATFFGFDFVCEG